MITVILCVACLSIGACIGVVVAGLLAAAKRGDEHIDDMEREFRRDMGLADFKGRRIE